MKEIYDTLNMDVVYCLTFPRAERISVTSHQPYIHLITGDRDLKRIDSHMSKYNSSMLYFN